MIEEAKRPTQLLALISGAMGCPDQDGEIIERAAQMYLAGDPEAGRWMTRQVVQAVWEHEEKKKDSSAPAPGLAGPKRALVALAVWRVVSQNPVLAAAFFIGLPLLGAWHSVEWLLSFIFINY